MLKELRATTTTSRTTAARSFRFFGRDRRAVAGDVGDAEDEVVEESRGLRMVPLLHGDA